MVARVKVDWDAIEPHYRAGIRTLKDMGAEFGVSDAGIFKHAKKFKWTRNLAGKIKALAEAKVSALEVNNEVNKKKALTEAERIEVDSTKIATVCFNERKDLTDVRDLYRGLFEEFRSLCEGREDIIKLKELVNDPDITPSMAIDTFNKVVSFTGRIDNGKKLVETMKVLFELERKIFKLDTAEEEADNKFTDIVRRVVNG